MHITFKQFLLEGGKATEKLGTTRANKADIKQALQVISDCTNISFDELQSNLTGSTRLTYSGKQENSGDIDIVLDDNKINREDVIQALSKAVHNNPVKIGANTYSFAVPVNDKKVQVDLMFVPDTKWAKFSHYASEHSAHKSGVRNELLHSALKFSLQPDKDVRIKDENGSDIARASRTYNLDTGVERVFKISPLRKDQKSRVRGAVKVTPKEVQDVLNQINSAAKFSHEPDVITDPDKFAQLLFGQKVSAQDMLSAEDIIKLIKKYKAADAAKIFKDAVRGIKRLKFTVPKELQQYQ
jgi:hypothetical protein